MRDSRLGKALTGLATGAVLTAPLLGVFALGRLAGLLSVPFTVFEWFIRVLPGRLVIFGLELTVRVLEALGFNIKDTAKTAEQVLAVGSLFVGGLVIGLLFFLLVRTADMRRLRRYGLAVGGVVGVFSLALAFVESPPASVQGKIGAVIWILGLFLLWGAGMARLYLLAFPVRRTSAPTALAPGATSSPGTEEAGPGEREAPSAPGPGEIEARLAEAEAPQAPAAGPEAKAAPAATPRAGVSAQMPTAEAHAISRRRFIIQMGGLVATIIVVGAGVGEVLRAQAAPLPQIVKAPIPFPNATSAVQPAPGTLPEYTAVADHYRIDIDLEAPVVDGTTWRLPIDGLASNPLTLTLDQITTGFKSQEFFITLSCISNTVGGPLIGTTLWTGVPFRDILAQAQPQPTARYAHVTAADGFGEVVDLNMVMSDSRIMLVYAWNGQPLPQEHGYPLRIYVPDVHGMKQPKWIVGINLVADFIAGYWVARGWDQTARMHTTSVIDTVATDSLEVRGGHTYVPVGGIAHAGARGMSKVEVQVDNGPWEAAQLRAPLSPLTWVIWRYDWPFSKGLHQFAVRATDGQGNLQESQERSTFPSGATGIDRKSAEILPAKIA
jgi:DMSO/TMAO reductase YedYZ molybdopterin-dependent catalytic subunit